MSGGRHYDYNQVLTQIDGYLPSIREWESTYPCIDDLLNVVIKLPNLEKLRLRWLPRYHYGIQLIGECVMKLVSLRRLILIGGYGINLTFLKSLPNLTALTLSYCHLSDISCEQIAHNALHLQVLNISLGMGITKQGMFALQSMKQLQHLYIHSFDNINHTICDILSDQCPSSDQASRHFNGVFVKVHEREILTFV